MTFFQSEVDAMDAQQYAAFLSDGCLIDSETGEKSIDCLTEEELDAYLRSMKQFDL